jgi:short-subunit dehydrogenase
MLINNAGSGCFGNFEMASLTKNLDVIKLNIEACIKMTHLYLSHYDKSQKCYLLNVISTGAFQPIPNLATYAASKSFLLSFTKALRFEQKSNNLVISALCPGGADSDFFIDARMVHVSEQNKNWLMAPSKVAFIGIQGLFSNKKIIIPGLSNKLHVFLTKIIPERIIFLFTAKIYK